MKKLWTSAVLFGCLWLCLSLSLHAQTKNVNEICTGDATCKSGICLKLRSGKYVCGTCNQSTYDNLAPKVDTYCKAFAEGWRAEKAPEYLNSLVDGRVNVEVYDEMLEKVKECKAARVNMVNTCFKGGADYDERDHAEKIREIERGISKMAAHKSQMISDRRVYYCSKSTYAGALSQYKSKCDRLDLNRMKQKMSSLKYEFGKGNKIDCDILEDYVKDCEECAYAIDDLIKYGFKNSSSYTPKEFSDRKKAVEDVQIDMEELLSDTKSKKLCD